jgi:hypothetical protein
MPEDQIRTDAPTEGERKAKNAGATPPRGNQEPDHDSVDKGKEQLNKISGN